ARAYLKRFGEGLGAGLEDEATALYLAKKLANDVERWTTTAARVTFLQIGTEITPQDLLTTIEPAYLRAKSDPHLGVGHPALLDAQSMYGVVLTQSGRIEEGLAELQDALAVALSRHGAKSYVAEKALFALSLGQFSRDVKAAIETQEKAYSIAASNEPL